MKSINLSVDLRTVTWYTLHDDAFWKLYGQLNKNNYNVTMERNKKNLEDKQQRRGPLTTLPTPRLLLLLFFGNPKWKIWRKLPEVQSFIYGGVSSVRPLCNSVYSVDYVVRYCNYQPTLHLINNIRQSVPFPVMDIQISRDKDIQFHFWC